MSFRHDTSSVESERQVGSSLTREHRRLILVLIVGVFLPLLDATAVNIAVREMSIDLAAPLSLIQWVSIAYTLAAAAVIPLSAWSVHRIGPKKMWIAGLLAFLAGSSLAAAAWSAESLIAFRVMQGIGAGLLMPIMQTLLIRSVGQRNARAALAAMAVPSVIAPILGPLVGGLALHYGGWRYIFGINIPLCLLGIHLALRHLKSDEGTAALSFDGIGFLLLCPGVVLTVYGLSTLGDSIGGNSTRGVALSAVGIGLGTAFVLFAKKWTARPLIDVGLFRVRSFRSSALLLLLSSVAFYGGLLLLPLYFLQRCRLGTIETSALLAMQGVGALVSRHYLEPLSRRLGTAGLALASILLTILGTIPFMGPFGPEHWLVLAVSTFVRGAGLGLLTILALSTAYRDVDGPRIPDASALTRILTNLGASVGAASVLAVLQFGTGGAPHSEQTGFILAFGYLVLISLVCALPAGKLGR
ncbi:MFS transporter [Variovorax sp. M-6]|uniref:MFS transporter n=1 Tax=Variovorax sp. M-6 TaxID=3233041 RepID=UPI003F98EB7A